MGTVDTIKSTSCLYWHYACKQRMTRKTRKQANQMGEFFVLPSFAKYYYFYTSFITSSVYRWWLLQRRSKNSRYYQMPQGKGKNWRQPIWTLTATTNDLQNISKCPNSSMSRKHWNAKVRMRNGQTTEVPYLKHLMLKMLNCCQTTKQNIFVIQYKIASVILQLSCRTVFGIPS